jgi:hypothetical protein
MRNREYKLSIDDRACGAAETIIQGLRVFASESADAEDFEDILRNAIRALFRMRPEGEKNYTGASSLEGLGIVGISRLNAHNPGKATLEYAPSLKLQEKFGYIQASICTLDLRERTYSPIRSDIPDKVKQDAREVLKVLNLKPANFPK